MLHSWAKAPASPQWAAVAALRQRRAGLAPLLRRPHWARAFSTSSDAVIGGSFEDVLLECNRITDLAHRRVNSLYLAPRVQHMLHFILFLIIYYLFTVICYYYG